jgi:hypothetical protein
VLFLGSARFQFINLPLDLSACRNLVIALALQFDNQIGALLTELIGFAHDG